MQYSNYSNTNIIIEWTTEKKEAVIAMLDKWLKKHNAHSGEMIMQDDGCQTYAPDLLSNLVDDIILPEYID